jgi:lipoyl(octanoyl) transferase
MRVRAWGRAPYDEVWRAMRDFTAARGPDSADELWLVEHEPVYTLGLAGRPEHVHAPGPIPVVATDRGGQVTYHGPGQLVVYTLIDLRRAGYFVRELVFRIEESVIQTLDALGVLGLRVTGAPGVYVAAAHTPPADVEPVAAPGDTRFAGKAKIAALGIKVSRGCSYHGVALNVAMDLSPYAGIDPCGYRGLAAIDLATLGVQVEPGRVAGQLVERLQAHLAGRAVPAPVPARVPAAAAGDPVRAGAMLQQEES